MLINLLIFLGLSIRQFRFKLALNLYISLIKSDLSTQIRLYKSNKCQGLFYMLIYKLLLQIIERTLNLLYVFCAYMCIYFGRFTTIMS